MTTNVPEDYPLLAAFHELAFPHMKATPGERTIIVNLMDNMLRDLFRRAERDNPGLVRRARKLAASRANDPAMPVIRRR